MREFQIHIPVEVREMKAGQSVACGHNSLVFTVVAKDGEEALDYLQAVLTGAMRDVSVCLWSNKPGDFKLHSPGRPPDFKP